MDLNNVMLSLTSVYKLSFFFLYAGPDQLLPLASFIGGVIGILLIGWQRLLGLVRRGFNFMSAKFAPTKRK